MKKALPYISIITISAFVGDMMVIGLGFGLYWLTLEPLDFMQKFAVQFPFLLPPTMGILLPALVTTTVLMVQSKEQKETRSYWRIALAGLVIACIITSVYHLPVNLDLMALKYTADEAASTLTIWLILHWVRTAVVVVAAVYSIKAFQSSLTK